MASNQQQQQQQQPQRPPGSRAGGTAGGARPGTASRPRTGANRPTTATVRPGTASRGPGGAAAAAAGAGASNADVLAAGPSGSGAQHGNYHAIDPHYGQGNTAYMDHWAEDEEEDDDEGTLEDDYESEDDGDVFAFVPPDIGPSVTLTTNPNDPVLAAVPGATSSPAAAAASASASAAAAAAAGSTGAAGAVPPASASQQQQQQQQSSASPSQSGSRRPGTSTSNRTALSSRGERGQRPASAIAMPPGTASLLEPAAEEDETFYYDEATGAVYDSQGRLVQMPEGFDPSAVMAQDVTGSGTPADGQASRGLDQELGHSLSVPSSGAAAGAGIAAGAASGQPGPSDSTIALNSIIHRTDADPAADTSNNYSYTFPTSTTQSRSELAGGSQQSGVASLNQPGTFAHGGLDRSRKDSRRSSFNSLDGYPSALRHAASINGVGLLASSDALASAQAGGGGGGGNGAAGNLPRGGGAPGGLGGDDQHVAMGMAYGGEDMPVGPGAQLGGRQQSLGTGFQNGSSGLLVPGKDSSDDSDDSKVKLDGDNLMMVMDNGEYYTFPPSLDANDAKALEAAGYGNGGMMIGPDGMVTYPLGMGQGLMHPVQEGTPVGPRGMRIVELEMETEEDSPYPEVRASVSNVDDPDMPVNTIRMWFLSLFFITLAGGANQLFSLRFPAVYLTPVIVQLISYPAGKLLAATLPIRTWTLPRWLGGASFSLNPGLFNIKEHTCIFIMANVATGPVYALNMIVVLDHPTYYNRPTAIGYQFLVSLSSQLFAFGFAGAVRRMLVYPASMIWPLNLVIATIFNTLHAEDDGEDGTMTRFRFFSIWAVAAFVFYFFPGYIFTALSVFNFVCWIWPTSRIINILFGTGSGLGMSLITFDWNQIGFTGNPLVIPWWAQCNVFAGFVLIIWVVAPALYFSNTFNFAYLPVSSNGAFDRFGQSFDVKSILADDGQTLDVAKYEAYSRINLTTTFFLTFWTGFAAAGALLTHTVLYHGSAIYNGIRYGKVEEDDIHAKHMRAYREAPQWWYMAILLVTFVIAVITVEIYDTGLPVWGLLLSMLLPAIYILPSGFLYALTGQLFGLNLVSEFVAGYLFPGRTVPNMIFKVYAQTGLGSSVNFLQDLKLGHYMKVPPRTTFAIQLVGMIWCSIVQVGVKQWAFGHIRDICTPDAQNRFVCPSARTFYTASILFGVLGPDRIFGKGSDYSSMYWSLLFGFLIPIPFWIVGKKWPKSFVRWISWPIILTGSSFIPPATGINIASWFSVGFFFQFVMRKYKFRWWTKYNFVLAASLDAGTIASNLVIFLCLLLPKQGELQINWWGNTVFLNTFDFMGMPWKDVPQEGFGTLPKA